MNESQNLHQLFSKVPHKNLIHVWNHGWLEYHINESETESLPVYIIDMELGRGSLHSYIKERFHDSNPPNFPSPAEAWGILAQVASIISFLQRKGIIHRDLKPENRNFLKSQANVKLFNRTRTQIF